MRKSAPSMAYSSAIFRKAAFLASDGLREEDGVTDDFAQLMRVAKQWDFAYVNRPLAKVRAHTEASSSELGWFMPGGFRSQRSMADIFYANRRKAIAEVGGPARRLAGSPGSRGGSIAMMFSPTSPCDRTRAIPRRSSSARSRTRSGRTLASRSIRSPRVS